MAKKCPKCGDPYGDTGSLMCQANGCLLVDRSPDPRDAEIARLKAEVERLREYERMHGVRSNEIGQLRADLAAHKRALAAGPAALRRAEMTLYRWDAAEIVEDAQAEAMKEEP